MRLFEGGGGKPIGRADIAAGTTQDVLIYHDPPDTPPSSWALVIEDPNGGSAVSWINGHERIAMTTTAAGLAVGVNVFGIGATPGPYGSSITVRITAATTGTFQAMLIRVNY